MKDLSNDDITSLDQIKWIFNGSKNPADFKHQQKKEQHYIALYIYLLYFNY